ncbi:Polyprenyl synthetase [Nakamurella multipartita DSM 44233]|jgi:geranylgeranyl diphosphate synthase type I|uniref:Polyprenyl synthetase n=1 Tax=Nakamurella multipartita (strain ATCC 700099 / DSM 44233 / CIP 104796 / JCM 9543 / NBRC 105858 / Y-104) TaxID=479431 RepID=C8XCS8_NAKMY|nr:Polyprenyl synthetase [Nakamurella multipartita DSM 44233]
MNRPEPGLPHTGRVIDADRLHAVITAELARRRADVAAVDPRLVADVELLVEFVTDGGKRLRPQFLWCGWLAGGGAATGPDADAVLQVAAALELLQACALLHDDIIDRSQRRRGRPSTHRAVAKRAADAGVAADPEHHGVSVAILLGDLALAWCDDLFLAGALPLGAAHRAAPVWRAMRTEVLAGQLLDLAVTVSAEADPATQERDAMRVNRYKTAAYTIERPLHLGAALAGAAPATIAALRTYGTDIGVAFQLRDDLLGVFGDPAVTGKPAGDDLVEGKQTVLLALARAELGRAPDRVGELADLDAGVGRADADTEKLTAIIAGTGAVGAVERRIAELVGTGLAALSSIGPDGRSAVPDPVHERLADMAVAATARRR